METTILPFFSWQCWRLNLSELPLFGNNDALRPRCSFHLHALIQLPRPTVAYCFVTVWRSVLSAARSPASSIPIAPIHCHVLLLFSFNLYFQFTSQEFMHMAASLFLLCSGGSNAARLMGLRFFFLFQTTHLLCICHLPSVRPSPDAPGRTDHLENLDPTSFAPAGLCALICCRDGGFTADLHLCYESSGSCLLTGKLQSLLATSLFSLPVCVLSPIMPAEMWWTHSTSLCSSHSFAWRASFLDCVQSSRWGHLLEIVSA